MNTTLIVTAALIIAGILLSVAALITWINHMLEKSWEEGYDRAWEEAQAPEYPDLADDLPPAPQALTEAPGGLSGPSEPDAPVADPDDPAYWWPDNQHALREAERAARREERRERTAVLTDRILNLQDMPWRERTALEQWDWTQRMHADRERWRASMGLDPETASARKAA